MNAIKLAMKSFALTVVMLCGAGLSAQAPTISSLTPNSGPEAGGTTVVVQGTGFMNATAVRFGGLDAASFSVMDDMTIQAVTPANTPGGKVVQVVTPSGVANSAANAFNYIAAQQPQQPLIDADIDLDTPGCSASATAPAFGMLAMLALPAVVALRKRRLAR